MPGHPRGDGALRRAIQFGTLTPCRAGTSNAPGYDTASKVIACDGSGQDGEWRCCAPWPEPRFEIVDGGIVDRLTGLLWHPAANLTAHTAVWREALAAVAELNPAGAKIVWRLAT